MNNALRYTFDLAKNIQNDVPNVYLPPAEGMASKGELVIAFSIVKNTRGYIEKIAHQINGAYEQGWYDACAVMIRRLVETLIIEVFEFHGIADKIKNPRTGDFFYLKDLVSLLVDESKWNLGRNTKKSLPRLKDIGDQSAHSRRFIAQRSDIDKVIPDLRISIQELIFLANLK